MEEDGGVRAAVSARPPHAPYRVLSVRPVKNGGPLGTAEGEEEKQYPGQLFAWGNALIHHPPPPGLISGWWYL